MSDQIKILFHNRDAAGVNYFRTQTPAQQLERDHSDKFRVEINPDLDLTKPETIEYLKSFHVIHYHRQLAGSIPDAMKLGNALREAGVTLIADIDDYWYLDKSHPYYQLAKQRNLAQDVMDNIKIADYVTTTTDIFADEIRALRSNSTVELSEDQIRNVGVFPNAVDPEWMRQFADNRKPDPNGRVRITYMAGSSHMKDVQQLRGVINRLNTDPATKDKFKIMVAGWDTAGTTTDTQFNKKFGQEIQKRGLWNSKMVKAINRSGGDIDLIPDIPSDLREKYRGQVFFTNQRPINSEESVYLEYEKILTDDYRLINDPEYIKWLSKYERDNYSNETVYGRRWTQKANIYAKVLDETDISIAPLADHKFNRMKSNLKQVECWSRKIPIVCSDIPPYNVDGIHERNSMLVPTKKNSEKYWFKYLKRMIVDEEFRNELGQNLYDDFSEKYHLRNVTNKRAEFYESLVLQAYQV
jgi:glycosyltransferase involved in cell wall biosynthesis